ncbi:uncharacterized protein [Pempheris klunzingeri]|uniref:uncharacterized protein n=1 Tax=Pempheris klunzingeri TaxID=3127111 RepID=UPI0039817A66
MHFRFIYIFPKVIYIHVKKGNLCAFKCLFSVSGSEISKCTGKTEETSIPITLSQCQEDSLNIHQALPHPNPTLLSPVVLLCVILYPHLVVGMEAMVMDQDLVVSPDMVTAMAITVMDTAMVITVMVMDMVITIMVMDMVVDIMVMDMDIMVMVMDMDIMDMDMDMDMVIGTNMATCMAIATRKEGIVTGPPAAPAAVTLTRCRCLDGKRSKTTSTSLGNLHR